MMETDSQVDLSKMLEHYNARPRDRRNRPCSCGSGKKFKKCCMRGTDPEPAVADTDATNKDGDE